MHPWKINANYLSIRYFDTLHNIPDGHMVLFSRFNLDSAVRSTHLTQPIDSPGKTGEDLITNKVIATSPVSPDKSIDYAMHALPTAESRFKAFQRQKTFHDTAFHPLRSRKSCSRKAEESV
jgi:hypothetical protein